MASAEISSANGSVGTVPGEAATRPCPECIPVTHRERSAGPSGSRYNDRMVVAPPDLEAQLGALLGETTTEIDVPRKNRVFCNRNLRMDSIEMIGFDMDYTLALYHQDKLEQLSIELTLTQADREARLSRGDPGLSYDPRWAIRGVMVDRQLGNVFKMDRHSHVGRCYHGVPRARSRRAQGDLPQREDQPVRRSLGVDRHAVRPARGGDVHDDGRLGRSRRPARSTTTKLFDDIRTAIDEAHRDDTLKSVIKADLPAYIVKDPLLGETLHKFRSSGKKLFLLTNSLYDYTARRHELSARRRAQGVPVVAQLLRHRDRRRCEAGVLQRAAAVRPDRPGRPAAPIDNGHARSSTSRATRSIRAATSSRSSR